MLSRDLNNFMKYVLANENIVDDKVIVLTYQNLTQHLDNFVTGTHKQYSPLPLATKEHFVGHLVHKHTFSYVCTPT